MERKALERLVAALLDEDLDVPRLEAIESALALALIALEGDEDFTENDEAQLKESLFMLAVQTLAQKLEDEDTAIFRGAYQDKDDAETTHFLVTTNTILGGMMDHNIKLLIENEGPYSVH